MNYEPPFTISNEMLNLVGEISFKVAKFDDSYFTVRYPHLRKRNRVKSIHASCAIEANSLSLDDVSDVINGIEVKGNQKDILEIKNAINAYDHFDDYNPYKEKDLLKANKYLTEGTIKTPGIYRTGNEGVKNEDGKIIFIAPPPEMVSRLMGSLFSWISSNKKTYHPLILSSVFHYEFVFIHPFEDGNGRTSRLWQSCLLSDWNSVFKYIPIESEIVENQDAYYDAISISHIEGNSNAFITFMLKMINSSLDKLIKETNIILRNQSSYVRHLLSSLEDGVYYSSNEILELLNLKSKETLRKNYLDPAIRDGLVELEFKDKPTSKNQRYKKI